MNHGRADLYLAPGVGAHEDRVEEGGEEGEGGRVSSRHLSNIIVTIIVIIVVISAIVVIIITFSDTSGRQKVTQEWTSAIEKDPESVRMF